MVTTWAISLKLKKWCRSMSDLTCFKAYDIRGRLGLDLDENIAYRIGAAFAVALNAKTVVLGRDVRASSEALSKSVAQGLIDQGCEVLDLGLSGTEEMYFATTHFGADGGICVTASHNPMDYNGMKMVRAGSAPLDAASGLTRIKELAEANAFEKRFTRGKVHNIAEEARTAYVERICQFVDISALKPLKILVNAGHGTAGPTFDAISARLADLGSPLVFKRLFHEPDGSFPQGIPNPLLPENRPATADAVRATGADFGVAWDGDFDRCFFFDHTGAIARVRSEFESEAVSIDEMDGLGFDMGVWRFNLRSSNTEPVVRLNFEARGDAELVVKGVERVNRALLG